MTLVSLYILPYIRQNKYKILNCSSKRVIAILFVRSYDYIMMSMSRFPSNLVFKQVYNQLKIN